MRTAILFLATLVVLVAGGITVAASPRLGPTTATRPLPSPTLVIETTPTPTPSLVATPSAAPTTNGIVTIATPIYRQLRGLDCETAALQMALAALGRDYTQDQLIAMQPAPDTRTPVMGPVVNGNKTVLQWGNPYKQFVGNIDGADWIPTGYGVYYPPLVSVAQSHGAPNAYGREGFSASEIYAALAAGHPVMAWVETGWMKAYVGTWTAWDGTRIRYSLLEHTVTLSGVSATQVRVNDPWRSGSQYWFDKAQFERSWADFNYMAIVLQ
jgi:uncharacterized protein YvpB